MPPCDRPHRPAVRPTVMLLLLSALVIGWPGGHLHAQDPVAPPEPPKVIYLTFDDGPSSYTQSILDVLARTNAKATFFVVGRQAAGQTELLRAMVDAGHGVANHTYNHPSLPALGKDRFRNEVVNTAQVLGDLDHGCLRPPYGAVSKAVRANAAELGYAVVLWTIDPRDWTRPGAAAIADAVIKRATPGGIVVLHDGGGDRSQTVAALEMILPRLAEQGYTFAALCREGAPSLPPVAPAPETAKGGAAPRGAEAAALPDNNGITAPKREAKVKGLVSVQGVAAHPAFRKWQLDLLINGSEETFLALGETPVPLPAALFAWDTTLYPNGDHVLRLRVVRDGLNYDEYCVPVTIDN